MVDYKATIKNSEVSVEADWQISFKKPMEVYQWLLRKNGFNPSLTGYFLYFKRKKVLRKFNPCQKFDIHILPYVGDQDWPFQTKSGAASVILGASANGNEIFRKE